MLIVEFQEPSKMSEAYLNSKACFRARALELGLEEAAITKAAAEGIGTMGGFGFACQSPPGIRVAKVLI